MEHPKDAEFEEYVIGALDGAASASFVAHVSECDACAAKLEAEARSELAILEIHAARRREARRPARTWRVVVGAATVVAIAAAVVLVVRSRKAEEEARERAPMSMKASAPRAAAPIPLTTCPDGIEQEKCIEDAHRHGLSVAYPPWASTPPLGGGSGNRGPNGSPFAPPRM